MSRELGLKQGEPRVLSSRMGFFYKYVISTYMIGGSFVACVGFFFIYPYLAVKMDPPDPIWYRWLLIPAFLFATGFTYFWCAPMKKIRISGDYLLISNWRREITVSLLSIGKVSEFRWSNPSLVFVSFRSPTAFGQRISFIPRTGRMTLSSMLPWKPSPIVEELRQRVREAGGNLE